MSEGYMVSSNSAGTDLTPSFSKQRPDQKNYQKNLDVHSYLMFYMDRPDGTTRAPEKLRHERCTRLDMSATT